MEDVKQCPYCGGEIHISAKKCRHCGKWIEKKCPVCGEWILVDAKKCKHCGSWLNKFTREQYEPQTANKQAPTKEEIEEMNKEIKDENDASCLMQVESWLITGIVWYATDKIIYALVTILILQALLRVHAIRIIYCLIISFLWAAIGFEIAVELGLSGLLGAVIFGGASLSIHYPAMRSGFN